MAEREGTGIVTCNFSQVCLRGAEKQENKLLQAAARWPEPLHSLESKSRLQA